MSTLLHSLQWLSLHGLFVLLGLLVYVLTSHALHQRRPPTAAIAWVLAIALVPYLGLPLYLMFGTRKLVRSGSRPVIAMPAPEPGTEDVWPQRLAASMGQPPAASYCKLRVHADGAQALRSLCDLIDGAERELVLCTFLIGRDAMGEALLARLIARARAGTRVRLLIDGAGRLMGGRPDLRALEAAGVQVALFAPLLHLPFKGRANLRNHRKLVVADAERLWCGGRNFAAEYFEGASGRPAWRDLSFDLEGPLAAQARALFEHDWAVAAGAPRVRRMAAMPVDAEPCAQVIASGPDQADDTIHDLLVAACYRARTRIAAVTPYFVPGDALLMALSLAARQGVAVDLVLPGRSNHRLADFARHRALRELVAAGGRVWLTPYMLHAKAVVIDDGLAMSGSANLDARSLFLNYELMVAFRSSPDVRRFALFIEEHRAAARPYRARKPGLLRDLAEGLVLWLAFQL